MAAEIDEEVLESWEDYEDSKVLDQRLNDIKIEKKSEAKKSGSTSGSTGAKLQEDSSRTAYQPTVKILKRQPKSDPGLPDSNRTAAAIRPIKSLEQREAEYAQARLRILGSATYEEPPAPVTERPEHLVQQVEELKLSGNIVRQPRGPDGSRGFSALANHDRR